VTAALLLLGGLAAALLLLHAELNLLGRAPEPGLRVLMYHRVGDHPARDTVPARALERQLDWLAARGYAFVSLSQLLAHRAGGAPLPPRPVLLTFDDGTADQLELLLPILRRRAVPAALFAVPEFVGKVLPYGGAMQRFLGPEELRELSRGGVQIGIHSFTHRNMARLGPAEVEEECAAALRFFAERGVPVEPVLAYPFGAYPRVPAAAREAFFGALRRAGVKLAFRIGNRVNPLPLPGDFEIQRIGIRRADAPWSFAIKVRKGRRKAFA
jgi:peptidoglycan/xylan/chitin deacetylase (PgdA/CDA1 family)